MKTSDLSHRERAVQDLTTDLVVTAGAGAGKTTVLVDRFVKVATEPGLGPDRVLAITFTRKAATEMRERIVRHFIEVGDTERRRATEAAYISTIHGFAERVLRERPFEARVDPAFAVISEAEQQMFLEESLRTMYVHPELHRYARRLGGKKDGGWRVFDIVNEVARLLREGSEETRREASIIHDADAYLTAALAKAAEATARMETRALAHLEDIVELLGDDSAYKNHASVYRKAQEYVEAAAECVRRGRFDARSEIWKSSITGCLVEEARDRAMPLVKSVKELAKLLLTATPAAQEALERELLPVKQAIYDAASRVELQYQSHKRRLGALDFHDLQVRATSLFAESTYVRDEYADRFRHILLDEVQDTDSVQHRLVSHLRVNGNVLFMVGDPKQAIYEFRGADPEVFQREVAHVTATSRLSLAENFRSRPEIVALVNELGRPLLGELFVPILPSADYGGRPLPAPAVTSILAVQETIVEDGEERQERVDEVRPRVAAAVAEEIVRLLQSEVEVRDPDRRDVTWVKLRPRHIALLFRARTSIGYYERAFAERNIPYVTAAGQGFYERAEVLDCMMALRALDQPLDDLAMATILRSPLVAATDGELLEVRALAGSEALYPGLRRHARLAAFRERWDGLRKRLRGRSGADSLDVVLEEFRYTEALAAHEDGRAMLANLAKLRRQLRVMGPVTCGAAYAELERLRDLMDSEKQAPLLGPADDVVVFTTVHQAKGLEWPVVCLPDLQARDNKADIPFSPRHGVLTMPALTADGEKSLPISIQAIEEERKERRERERRRLFYVALTRARERLMLSGIVTEKQARGEIKSANGFDAPLEFLLHHVGEAVYRDGDHIRDGYRTSVRVIGATAPEPTIFEGGEQLARTLVPVVVPSVSAGEPIAPALPSSVKVTELLEFRRCPQVYRFKEVLRIDEHLPRRAITRGREARVSPVELGTTVHALLERARFDASDLAAEADRLLADQPSELRGRLRSMLLPILAGEVGDSVRSARRVEREWPFVTTIGDVLVEGVIDLAVQDADGRWTVYDYKSNDFSKTGRFDYLVHHYSPQLELYALAMARAGIGDVTACALVFLAGPRIHRWRFDAERVSGETWTTDAIARISRGDFSTTAGPKCELCGYRKRKVCDVGRHWTPVLPSTLVPATALPEPSEG